MPVEVQVYKPQLLATGSALQLVLSAPGMACHGIGRSFAEGGVAAASTRAGLTSLPA